MKHISLMLMVSVSCIILMSTVTGQTPQAFKYQTVVRNAAGEILQNQNVSFRFIIHDVNPAGTVVYSETHSVVTNEFGLVSLNIGSGVPVLGTFSAIDWGSAYKYLETELDPAGGSSYTSMGTSQLLSVPYALYSENTANNDDADADPENELQTLSIDGNNLSISEGNSVVLPGSGITNRISDDDGDTWIDVERTGDNDSIIFTTFGMERMKISNNGYVEVSGQMIATGFQGDGSGLTGIPGDDLGDHIATGDLNMNGNAITNLDDPLLDSDAANKGYVDAQPGDNLGNHTATSDLDMNSHTITNLVNPINASDAANKGYVDAHPGDNLGNHTATSDLDMNSHTITNLVNPINASDAATKGYVDAQPGDNLGNHTATQNLAIGNNWISNDGNFEGIHIDTDGNVGINDATPDQDLTVNGNIRSSDQVMAGFGNSGSASYRFGTGYENSGLSSPLSNSVAVITDGTQRMIVTQNGNIGIGTNSPANNLHVQGSFRLANGSQANGRILFSDANGTASWSDPNPLVQNEWHITGNAGTVDGTNFIGTTDNVAVNFRVNNVEAGRIGRSADGSVFLGYQAGLNDDLSDNRNTFIGYQAGLSNTTGYQNTANGSYALYSNTTGNYNTANGYNSLFYNQANSGSVAYGYGSMRYADNRTTGRETYNTAIGYEALRGSTTAANNTGQYNTSVGYQSLFSNTTGSSNTANGMQALSSNTTGNYNTALGSQAGDMITTGTYNTLIGYDADVSDATFTNASALGNGAIANASNQIALGNASITGLKIGTGLLATNANVANLYYDNTTGLVYRSTYSAPVTDWTLTGNTGTVDGTNFFGTTDNVAVNFRVNNVEAGRIGRSADGSVFLGYQAGLNDDLSNNLNTFIGYQAGLSTTTGYQNTASGSYALYSNTTGSYNTANGYNSLFYNQANSGSVAYGYGSMRYADNRTTGRETCNTAIGYEALRGSTTAANNTGQYNTSVGYQSLFSNTTGSSNTANGSQSLNSNTTGSYNTANGVSALNSNTTGNRNTANGFSALYFNTTGSYNTVLGFQAGTIITTGTNNTLIGCNAEVSDATFTNVSVLGSGAIATANNQVALGNGSVTGLKIGTGALTTSASAANLYYDNATGLVYRSTYSVPVTDWTLTGNAGTVDGTNFIGTTDNVAVNFRVNNVEAGRIGRSADGSVFLGYQAGLNDDLSDNRNTFIGYQAGLSNTTGYQNTANGSYALYSNTTGTHNTANGYNSLFYNQANSGSVAYGYGSMRYADNRTTGRETYNTAIGYEALRGSTTAANNTGQFNTSVGYQSLWSNTSGNQNTANGSYALYSNTTGSHNTANGVDVLFFNTEGDYNTANGSDALYSNTTGSYNTANGYNSLLYNQANSGSVAYGYGSMCYADNRTTGRETYNTAIGYEALRGSTTAANNTGQYNTSVGYQSLWSNTSGNQNTANGSYALYSNTTGSHNTANGNFALYSNTTGYHNTANGVYALYLNETGYNNTAVGYDAFSLGENYINSTGLGYNAEPGASNTVRIGNSSVTTIGGFANWTNVSDGRFKKNVQENVVGLAFIKKLRPVTYQLDMDAIASFNKTPDSLRLADSERLKEAEIQSGFIAQEVEQAALNVGYDFHGVDKPKNETSHYGLRYAEFVVPLVKAVQELADQNQKLIEQNEQQTKDIEHLKAELNNLKNSK